MLECKMFLYNMHTFIYYFKSLCKGKNYVLKMIAYFNGSQFYVPYEGGELDFQKLLGKFPGLPWAKYKVKKHLPGNNFTGAQTNLDKRLFSNQPVPASEPINRIDAAAMRHDILYRDNKDLEARHAADRRMIQELDAIRNPTMHERFDQAIVKKVTSY